MGNKVKPTKLQKATLEIIKENPDIPLGKAMITAGYAENTSRSPNQKLVESKGMAVAIEEWREKLRGRGLGEGKLLDKYEQWLDAKKSVSAIKTSRDATADSTDFIEVDDYPTQLKAGEWIREELGVKPKDVNISFNFNQIANKQRDEYKI